jgi:hypothetical protein
MIKKTGLILLLVMSISRGFAQNNQDPQLPQLLPVTPTAAGLIKAGLGEVNKSTGAATANIPLYELKTGNFKLPISLNYYSQGNKAEELCSRVGFGWSLAAGGVITRRIMGMPDGAAARYPVPAGNLAIESQENLDFFEAAKTAGAMTDARDAQPDEYHFSFCGHSGKFVTDDNGNPVIISHENLKIAITGAPEISIITITTPDGIQYLFGGNDGYEKTNHTGAGGGIFPKTSFYLTKIILPAGQQINLNYTRLQTTANTGFSETAKFPEQCPAGSPYPNGMTRSFSFQYIVNDACYLSNITTSEGVQVDFGYVSMADLSDDKKLQSFSVINQNSKEVKRFEFEYGDEEDYINAYPNSPNTNIAGRNGRFYLKKLHEKYLDQSQSLDYSFDYYGNSGNITTNVFQQDHYGFKNGKSFNQSIIPATSFLIQASPGTYWADRTSDWHASVQGMLHTINYPTKGKEEFFYEANTISVMKDAPDFKYITRTIYGTDQPATNYDYLTVLKDQNIYINLSWVGLSPSCGPVCPLCKVIRYTIKDATTNSTLRTFTLRGDNNPIYDSLSIVAGHQYSFESVLYPSVAQCIRTDIQIKYDAAPPGLHPAEEEAGGVRVNRIAKTDAFGANLNKYFYYGAYNNPLVSTGQLLVNGSYAHNARTWTSQDVPQECSYAYWSSDGIYNTCAGDPSHIFYRNIIEADSPLFDASFANGAAEYTFSIPAEDNINQIGIRGEIIPNPPGGLFPNATGQIDKIKYFDNAGSLKAMEENTYEKIYFGTPVRSIYIRKAFSIISGSAIWVPLTVHNLSGQFDVREAQYNPGWIRLSNTTKTQYDKHGNPFVTNITYTYGTAANVLPAQISTTDSKNNTIVSVKKYPTDFPADPVLTAMVTANMISSAVEESKTQNLTELAKTKVTYQNNGTSGGGFQPSKIQQKQTETAAMEDRILFSGYDNKGNLTEVSKASDSKIAYLWNYNQSLVTAEVKNSVKEDIAYTSFEADSKGNFTYTGSATADATAPTGKMAYDLSGGTITAPAAAGTGKPYIVSYWSKAGAKTVTGSSNLTTGRSVSGWTYYEHTISSLAAGTTISGSGLIDELRLYPATALMTTFTYEPLVGITSQCDVNNRISYYEYDGLNRLAFIRDQNKNIAKKICYNYAGLPEDCSGVISYHNVAVSQSFTRNNCGSGYTGTSYTYTVPANTYTAATQAAADQLAANDIAANGQNQANIDGHGSCIANQFGNVLVYSSISKNDCGSGYTGSLEQLLIPANTYFANTQNDADALANAYLAANLQSHANAVGSCTPFSCNSSNCTGIANKCINGNCEAGVRNNISSVRTKVNGVFIYRCTYVYCFSDNSYSANQIEDNTSPCTVGVNCMN